MSRIYTDYVCGVCGILAFNDGFPADENVIAHMRDSLVHRGPDDAGTWRSPSGRVAFGHQRLSIVDLSPAGHQPMANEDETIWITYNGEVYNHRALRAELEARGHRYHSHTDTETILHLYEEEGPACVERLQGMFAFAIWDERRRELFLARDRLGIKPLYYAQLAGGVLFASEIKALLEHPSIVADLDEDAFNQYLTFACTPAPLTLFTGIRKLAPAERMVVTRDGAIRSEIYWSPFSPQAAAEVVQLDEAQVQERLLTLLRSSIRKRMMADVPFGVFLSGGVDSSTNVALMSELMNEPVRTFSVGFKEFDRYNELEYAREISQMFRTDHHEVILDTDDFASFLPDLIYHQDEPIADWVCVPLHFVARLAREHGTIVVQIGEGSDELFHGYDWYVRYGRLEQRYGELFRRLPPLVRRGVARSVTAVSQRGRRSGWFAEMLGNAADGRLPFWGGALVFQGDLKRRVMSNGQGDTDTYATIEKLWREVDEQLPGADLRQRMTYVELKRRLAELLLMRVDKMTMATSVEARVPFLDHELVEFVLALPPEFKVRGKTGKYILKQAVSDILPERIVTRPKQGFGAPLAEWFRADLGARAQQWIRKSSLAERALLDYDEVDRLWADHRAGTNRAMQLWNLLNVSAWYDFWIAKSPQI
jgi:asparagine synthase (glutamine-hydrolysing)